MMEAGWKEVLVGKLMEFSDAWDLQGEQINSAADLILKDGTFDDVMNEKDNLLLFLYAKGIMEWKQSDIRILEFMNVVAPVDPKDEGLQSPQARLRRIVEKGESSSNTAEHHTLFDEFVKEHPEWSDSDSYVVFRDHPKLKSKSRGYVERVQLSGLCYMHAPIVLQHYLATMNRESDAVGMIDMAVYLKRYVTATVLERHIWLNQGGDSHHFLKGILQHDSKVKFNSYSNPGIIDLSDQLEEFGPGLVSGFAVDDNFQNHGWQYLGERQMDKILGCHAMVLVGYRREGTEVRYLLQNWWKKKPFVEVDGEYLENCEAMVHFVRTPVTQYGNFPLNQYDHVECEILDAPENFMPEMANSEK